MTTNFSKPYLITGLHILSWLLLGFIMLFYIPLTWNVILPSVLWIWQSILLLLLIVLFYTNAKIIVPKTIINNNTSPFLIWALLTIFAMQFIAYLYTSQTDLHHRVNLVLGFKKYRNPYSPRLSRGGN